MKDLSYDVTLEIVNQIISMGAEHDIEIEQYEGALNDLYIIHNNGLISIKSGNGRPPKGRKFIIIVPFYQNEWSDRLVAICTDNNDTVEQYRKKWNVSG